jgi:hypothetical protein
MIASLVAYALGLILMSFACGWLFALWFIGPNSALWPVLLLAAVLVVWFARFARMLWTQYA